MFAVKIAKKKGENWSQTGLFYQYCSDFWSGAEQRAQGADPEAGVWLVGWSFGRQHAAGGGGTCGSGGATGVSPGGEGCVQQAIASPAGPQSPL